MKTNYEVEPKKCVGCGFCCKKAPCAIAARIFGAKDSCPALVWDEEQHRYWCDICRKSNIVSAKYKAELSIGEGCCCGLNSDRNNIQPPAKKTNNILSREVQVLLSAVASEWIGGDILYFVLRKCEAELGEDWALSAAHLIDQQRKSHIKNFMG